MRNASPIGWHGGATDADHGPTANELERVKAQFEREWLSDLAGITTRADELSSFATQLGDARSGQHAPGPSVHALTPDVVGEAARRWLGVHSHARLIYRADPSPVGDSADRPDDRVGDEASRQEEER